MINPTNSTFSFGNLAFSPDKDTVGSSLSQTPTPEIISQRLFNGFISSQINTNTEIPSYFKFGGEYAQYQFAIGWTKRNLESGRIQGDIASHLTHPDINTDFEKLPEGVKNFIHAMSCAQVALYLSLGNDKLSELKKNGKEGFAQGIIVSEPLLNEVNKKHHELWMATRDLARCLNLNMTVRDHTCHKERSLLTETEIQADNAQVQAYAVQLANLSEEHFNWLLENTRN